MNFICRHVYRYMNICSFVVKLSVDLRCMKYIYFAGMEEKFCFLDFVLFEMQKLQREGSPGYGQRPKASSHYPHEFRDLNHPFIFQGLYKVYCQEGDLTQEQTGL